MLKAAVSDPAAIPQASRIQVISENLRNEKINYKVREHSLAKVPNLLVVGKREAEEGKVALRQLGRDRQQFLTLDEAIAIIRAFCSVQSFSSRSTS